MKYIVIILAAATLFLGYRSYTDSKKVEELTKQVTEINEIIHPKEPPLIAAGTDAPDFSLLNVENEAVTLGTFAPTKRKVFVFSAKDCSYCKEYYPQLAVFTEQHQDIPVIVVQGGATIEENKDFLVQNNYTFEMLKADDEIYQKYQVSGTPTTIVLDENNKVVGAGYFSTAKEIEGIL